MKFSEYLNRRGTNSMTLLEHEILGIRKKKGFVKRHADQEITQEQLQRLSEAVQSNKQLSGATIGKIMTMTKSYELETGQYLYFMVNEIGRTKIGISKDPLKRARALTTGSGLLVKCLKAWKLEEETALQVEQKVLKKYLKYKTYGEWFIEGTVDVERIDDFLDGNCFKALAVYEDQEVKDEFEFYDSFDFQLITHQTEKAYLFDCGDYKMWIPKKIVKRIDKSTGVVKVVKGKLKDMTKMEKELIV